METKRLPYTTFVIKDNRIKYCDFLHCNQSECVFRARTISVLGEQGQNGDKSLRSLLEPLSDSYIQKAHIYIRTSFI